MPILPNEVRTKLQQTVTGLVSAEEDTVLQQWKELRKVLIDVERYIPEARLGLDAFFEAVSSGMLSAQRRLDDEARRYNDEQLHRENWLPTTYRIPKASAEFQFGLENRTSKGFNVLILSGEKSVKEEVHHKVNFDIVATPPTPEMLQSTLDWRPLIRSWLEKQGNSDIAKQIAQELDKTLLLRGEGLNVLVLRSQARDGIDYLNVGLLTGPEDAAFVRIPYPATGWRQEVQSVVNALAAFMETRQLG